MKKLIAKVRRVIASLVGITIGVAIFLFVGQTYLWAVESHYSSFVGVIGGGTYCSNFVIWFFMILQIIVIIIGLIGSLLSGNAIAEYLDPTLVVRKE